MSDNHRFTALVADDESHILELLSELLMIHGFKVFKAGDGEEAWDILKKINKVDIVISDVFMPKMSGIELMKKIKRQIPALPVILITAYINKVNFGERNNGGVQPDGFFTKPFDIHRLIQKIDELLPQENLQSEPA